MRQLLLLLTAVLVLHGCTSLPDARVDLATLDLQPVQFVDAHGPVPVSTSAAILKRIDHHGSSGIMQQHLPREQAINAGNPLVLGNRLTLLQNGPQTYRNMFEAIRSARDHINLETYIFDDDEIGRQFTDLLLERQADGVQVNIIYDSIGALLTPREFFDRLRNAGINVLEFNPINPLKANDNGWKLNNRDHRRQLIVDGRIAFTGGVNISATYSSAPGSSRNASTEDQENKDDGWRDTHLRVEGPVVAQFQQLFVETWERQKGEPLPPRDYFPKLQSQGHEIVRVIGSTSSDEESRIYLTLISAINSAQRNVHLTIAYFAPDAQLREALASAARRGVEVRLVLPSFTDSSPIFHLGRSYYTELLQSGISIYERRGAIMHAKTASIDGVWSTVGSTNLDWRSFLHNDEINAVVLGRGFATAMDAMFRHDVSNSDVITLEQWKKRPLLLRIKERMARIAAYWM
jgi:cardiolipin synthase